MTSIASVEPSSMLVLSSDVDIVPIREFPADLRQRLGGSASDFVLSDRSSRIGSQRIAGDAADFLRRFREPRRVVEAVFEHSVELKRDPMKVLDEVWPLIATMCESTVLLDAAISHRRPLGPALSPGALFEGWRIVECISDLAETDVYKAEAADGTPAAIKYLRAGSDRSVRENMRREADVLRHAEASGCAVAPRLLAADVDRDDAFLALQWFEARMLATLLRTRDYGLARRRRLAVSLLDAYLDLHRRGVLHGDVHPGNVLVLADDSVRLVDFGGARLVDRPDEHVPGRHARIGLVQFYEPEVARSVLAGGEPPPPSPQGEQYCVAALAWSAIVGTEPLALSLETEAALGQIAEQPPRAFAEFGLGWPSVERALMRALAKEPALRFDTMADFRDALVTALSSSEPATQSPAEAATPAPPLAATARRDLLADCVGRFKAQHGLAADLTLSGLPRGPKSSLYAGGGGIAWALLRLACLQDDAACLAAADVWIARALALARDPYAFTDGSVGSATETGPIALFHSMTGLHAINALTRNAAGDREETWQALTAFADAVPLARSDGAPPSDELDLFPQDTTNGAASLLLGASLLLPLCRPEPGGIQDDVRQRIEAIGRELYAVVEDQLVPKPPATGRLLGFAHGRTGALHSLLRWAEVSGDPPSPALSAGLEVLAGLARRRGEALAWPIDAADRRSPSWTGWCHGSAGHLLTWTTAARVLRRPDWLDLAAATGHDIWEQRGRSGPSLCCGAAGEALSLFDLARACGDSLWIDRGIELATQAVATAHHLHDAQGLFRSEVGVALAAAEALQPETSAWPVCQAVG